MNMQEQTTNQQTKPENDYRCYVVGCGFGQKLESDAEGNLLLKIPKELAKKLHYYNNYKMVTEISHLGASCTFTHEWSDDLV